MDDPTGKTDRAPEEQKRPGTEIDERTMDGARPTENPKTALDSILDRGQSSIDISTALAMAGLLGAEFDLPSLELKHRARPLPPIKNDAPEPMLPRAWLLRDPAGTKQSVCCSESIMEDLRKVLRERGFDSCFGHFYKFVCGSTVAVFHFDIVDAELTEEEFSACVEDAETHAVQSAKPDRPADLDYIQKRRRNECKGLSEYGIHSAESLIAASSNGVDYLPPSEKSIGLRPEILYERLPFFERFPPARNLPASPNALLLHEDSFCGGRQIYLWKSRQRMLWLCNRVRNQEPFYSSLKEANFSRYFETLSDIDYSLEFTFGYSLTDFGVDPIGIYDWLMRGNPAYERRCR